MDENEYFGETRQEENIYPDESPRDEDILSLPDEPEVTDETVCAEETFAADTEIPLAAETFQGVTETPAEQTLTPAFPEPMFNIPPMLTRLEGLDRESFWEEVGKAKPQRKKPKKALVVLCFVMFILSVLTLLTVIYGRGWLIRLINGGKNIDFTLPIAETPKLEEPYYQADGRYTVEGIAKAVSPSVVAVEVYSSDMVFVPTSQGSGIIMSEDGYILTNAHVVENGKKLKVVLSNKAEYYAEVIGSDSAADIAVLKISAGGLTPAQFGNSDNISLGEDIVAIGSPAGFYGSVTKGIVSGTNRLIKVESYSTPMRCIQIDAAINPGNSGGALLNMWGQVVGITSSKLSSKSYDGIGFAITVNSAKPVIEAIMSGGGIEKRARIGITYYAIPESTAVMEGIKAGLYVVSVDPECDVSKTDLQPGDIITVLDGQFVSDTEKVRDIISSHKVGDTITAKVYRPDKEEKNKGIDFEISFKMMEDKGSLVEKKD